MEESYAELDAYLSHRHPDVQHHLRQTLNLAILSGAREVAMYEAHLRRSSGGRPFVGWSYQEAEEQLHRLEGGYEAFWGGTPRHDLGASSLFGSDGSYAPDTVLTLDDAKKIMLPTSRPPINELECGVPFNKSSKECRQPLGNEDSCLPCYLWHWHDDRHVSPGGRWQSDQR